MPKKSFLIFFFERLLLILKMSLILSFRNWNFDQLSMFCQISIDHLSFVDLKKIIDYRTNSDQSTVSCQILTIIDFVSLRLIIDFRPITNVLSNLDRLSIFNQISTRSIRFRLNIDFQSNFEHLPISIEFQPIAGFLSNF